MHPAATAGQVARGSLGPRLWMSTSRSTGCAGPLAAAPSLEPGRPGRPLTEAVGCDYHVVVSRRAATPVRFDHAVAERLAAHVAAHPGSSMSSAANRLVDEGLRMAEHPGIVFRDGPTGRRAGLVGGPDVWEVVRAVRSARTAEPELTEEDILALVATNAGLPLRLVRIAVRYWASYPDEVDAAIAAASTAEDAAERAWQREQRLLAR